jgi:hypothetical protein
MMVTDEEVASFLLREWERRLGYRPIPLDVEFHRAEPESGCDDMLAYLDDETGRCTPIAFKPPPMFDGRRVALLMMTGGFLPTVLH